jgi:hypothetical protein
MRRIAGKEIFRSFEPGWTDRRLRRFERKLSSSPEMRKERQSAEALRRDLAESAAAGFRPGFADRVLARLAACPAAVATADLMSQAFRSIFDRFALVTGLVAVALLLANWLGGALIPSREISYASTLTISRLLETPLW